MLAQEALEGEDTGTAVAPGPGAPADRPQRAGADVDRRGDVTVADDLTVADDHGFPRGVWLGRGGASGVAKG